jgi:protein-tyrosine phosphatase
VTFRILKNTLMDQVDRALAEQNQGEVDANWITDRIALGGWVETPEKMQDVAQSGITHILNMAWEFDERELAAPYGIKVFLNTVDDDFAPKSPEVLEQGVQFALSVLEEPNSKLLIHCVAGRHRGPMMTLAVLCVLGWDMNDAMRHISERRPLVDWTPVYVESVTDFLQQYEPEIPSLEAAARVQHADQSPQ